MSELMPYKQKVVGSIPSTPTNVKAVIICNCFLFIKKLIFFAPSISAILWKINNASAWYVYNFEIHMKSLETQLHKLQQLLSESEYIIRYERGTFQSGWCLLEQKRIVVLNKFLDTEGRINTLLDLIPQIQIDFDKLTLESQKLYKELPLK